ncbi:MAG: hypothetical protein A2286_00045 [Gammaproteobacteria bacterium RIFOXYA12_FULL_61_12]|nr:MAG: hypothetical protein A2286_00045 [Gammaproteobacteria bacterium RIFOXYA12_FULL_61_12]
MDPVKTMARHEDVATGILLSAFHAGGAERHWRTAAARIRSLESSAERAGFAETARLLRRVLEQVGICIQRPEVEMARLRAINFGAETGARRAA